MTEIQEKEIREWHIEGVEAAGSYLRNEARLVELLCKMHESKGYLIYRAETLRQYAISLLLLPENAVYDLVTVAKKASEVPAMIDALRERKATVSKLRKVCPVITFENQKEWLDLVRHCTTRIIERCVAEAKPETEVTDSSIQKSSNLVKFTAGISVSTRDALELLRELKSQRDRKAAKMGDVLAELAEMGLKKFDPVQKAKRAMERDEIKNSAVVSEKATVEDGVHVDSTLINQDLDYAISQVGHSPLAENDGSGLTLDVKRDSKANSKSEKHSSKQIPNESGRSVEQPAKPQPSHDVAQPIAVGRNARSRLPARLVHEINLRDGVRCTQIGLNGDRCTTRRWLDFHHVQEVALGGMDDLNNLTTLCSAHHRLHHFIENRRRGNQFN